jgi:hypothetical protein
LKSFNHFTAIICSFVLSCTLFSQENSPQNNWSTLSNGEYSIQYPSDWELNESGMMGTTFIFLSPVEGETDQFRENVNMVVQDLNGEKVTMDQFVEVTTKQLQNMINDVNIQYSERVEKNGDEFHRMIYTGTQGVYNLKLEQYYFLKNGKFYVLTLTTEIVTFKKFSEIGERILDSFQLK